LDRPEPSAPTKLTGHAPIDHDWFCLNCHYCLRGLNEPRCPECRRVFNPDDPSTYDIGAPMSDWVRWWFRPAGWPLCSLTAAASLLTLCGLAVPSRPNDIVSWGMLLWDVAAMIWVARVTQRRNLGRKYLARPFGCSIKPWLLIHTLSLTISPADGGASRPHDIVASQAVVYPIPWSGW
jgi:hypothetical protein